MGAVFKREFRSYFTNMTGYVFIGIMWLFCGIFTFALNFLSGYASFEYVLGNQTIVLMLIVPVLTMRSMAEDRKNKTDQLLFSLPIKTSAVVIGKYLAMVCVYGVTCLGMGVVPLVLTSFGKVNVLSAFTSLFGFFLLGSALIAVCMFMSALTESQIIAAVLGIGATLALYLMSALASLIPADEKGSFVGFIVIAAAFGLIMYLLTKNYWVGLSVGGVLLVPVVILFIAKKSVFEGLLPRIVNYLAAFDRFNNLSGGVFDITAVVYYITFAAFFVYLSVQSMEKRRWS